MKHALATVYRRIGVACAACACFVLAIQSTTRSAEPSATQPLATQPSVRRILFLGNSITWHGRKPDIGWTGNWGMAASAADKDYVHLVTNALAAQTGTAPEMMVENIADFERNPETFDFKARLAKALAFNADIIVVAIGENAPSPHTDAAKAAFRGHFQKLLETLKANRVPAIFVRSCFWPDPAKDEVLKSVALEAGATFVDISALGKDPSNRAGAERQITHPGVAAHPGDKGMKAIADALLKAMAERAAPPKELR